MSRADDSKYDLVLSGQITRPQIQLGASAYLGEFKADRNIAIGGDIVIPTCIVTISEEAVYQKNSDIRATGGP